MSVEHVVISAGSLRWNEVSCSYSYEPKLFMRYIYFYYLKVTFTDMYVYVCGLLIFV